MQSTEYGLPPSIPFLVTVGSGDYILKEWLEAKPYLTEKFDDLASRLSKATDKPVVTMGDFEPFQEEIKEAYENLKPFTSRISDSIRTYEKILELPRVPQEVEKLRAIRNDALCFKEHYTFLKKHN